MKMDQKQMAKADFVTAILLILTCLFIMMYVFLAFPRFPEWGTSFANPGFVPVLLAFAVLLMSLNLLVRSLRRQGHQIRITRDGLLNSLRANKSIRFLTCLGLFVLYYLLLGRIPFLIDTTLYLFLSFLIFGRGKWFVALLIAVATSYSVDIIFTRIFLVPLP
jgi:hypothetical protein